MMFKDLWGIKIMIEYLVIIPIAFIVGFALWLAFTYHQEVLELESIGCFEKDHILITLNDLNRSDYKIVKLGDQFFICPT